MSGVSALSASYAGPPRGTHLSSQMAAGWGGASNLIVGGHNPSPVSMPIPQPPASMSK